MDQELQEEAFEFIAKFVKYGFYPSKEKVLETLEDTLYDEELDMDLIEKEIDRVIAAQLEEEKSWNPVTDFDRLAECFSELNENSIIAIHFAGNTQSDGFEDSSDRYKNWKEEGKIADGYCFYTSQDTEGAIDGRDLYLAFGAFEQHEKNGVGIGQRIVEVLMKHGFSVEWNNSIKTRIVIRPFVWQKRFGSKPCYD